MIGSVAHRQRALDERVPEWTPCTLHGALDRAAGEYPSNPYIVTDSRTWSYAETAEATRRLARGLVALGISPGDKVALILANYPEFVIAKYAISRAGAVAVPI